MKRLILIMLIITNLSPLFAVDLTGNVVKDNIGREIGQPVVISKSFIVFKILGGYFLTLDWSGRQNPFTLMGNDETIVLMDQGQWIMENEILISDGRYFLVTGELVDLSTIDFKWTRFYANYKHYQMDFPELGVGSKHVGRGAIVQEITGTDYYSYFDTVDLPMMYTGGPFLEYIGTDGLPVFSFD